jgi:hypothetical protein
MHHSGQARRHELPCFNTLYSPIRRLSATIVDNYGNTGQLAAPFVANADRGNSFNAFSQKTARGHLDAGQCAVAYVAKVGLEFANTKSTRVQDWCWRDSLTSPFGCAINPYT